MEQDTRKYLVDARKKMVEQRRIVIRSLAGQGREQLEAHINMMLKIQNAIDVIDRVSRDERAMDDNEADR